MSPNTGLIVLYGGTFDPFHKGHEAICRSILSHSEVAELRLIPCAVPALKEGATADANARLEMLKLWRAGESEAGRIIVDDIELQRDGPSYTVDTIEAYAHEYGSERLVFALGADAWNQLMSWHRYEQLVALTGFWVFHRMSEIAPRQFSAVEVAEGFERFAEMPKGHVFKDVSVSLPLASSDLRNHASEQLEALPSIISDYIKQTRLYSMSETVVNR